MDEGEQEEYARRVQDHYEAYAHTFPSVFEKHFEYREPLLINYDRPEILDHPHEQLYCFGLFAKPGRVSYVIKPPQTKELIEYQLLCPMRDETVPLVRFEDPAAGPAKKDVFKKERSIFAAYPEDSPKVMQRCWDYDKQLWKIARLTKGSAADYEESCELLRRNYQWLKCTFVSMCA